MTLGLEKYKIIGRDWLKKSDEELEFIAMRAELKHLKQNPARKAARTTNTRTTGSSGKSAPATGSGSNRNTGKFAWKGVAPKAGESHEKKVDGKDYIYCPHHESTCWVLKINRQGIEHKTGCRKMAEALLASPTTVALTGVIETDLEDLEDEDI